MASCSYSFLLKEDSTLDGSSWKNPEDFQCVIQSTIIASKGR